MTRAPARLLPAAFLVALALLGAPAAHAQFGLIGGGIVFDPSNFARNVLAGARAQAQVFHDGLDRLTQMKGRVATVQGHEAALELQNTATVFTAEELMLLRQALMAQSSMEAVYYTNRVNTEAQQAATT